MDTENSLFGTIVDASIPFDSHESDLYFPVTDESKKILSMFPTDKKIATMFTNQCELYKGELWFDVPFAYLPWWEHRRQ